MTPQVRSLSRITLRNDRFPFHGVKPYLNRGRCLSRRVPAMVESFQTGPLTTSQCPTGAGIGSPGHRERLLVPRRFGRQPVTFRWWFDFGIYHCSHVARQNGSGLCGVLRTDETTLLRPAPSRLKGSSRFGPDEIPDRQRSRLPCCERAYGENTPWPPERLPRYGVLFDDEATCPN